MEIKEAKRILKEVNPPEITDSIEEAIMILLEELDRLERENKNYKYSKVPYLEGYISGLQQGIENIKNSRI